MRNVRVAVALAALVLAGCGSTSEPSSPPSSGSSTTSPTTLSSASPEPSAPGAVPPSSPGSQPGSQPGRTGSAQPPQTSAAPVPDASEVPADRVDGSTLPDTYKQRVLVSGDGRTLQVIGLTGGCKNASAEVTAQSGDSVLITLVSTYYPPEGGGMCSQELRDIPLTVTLDAPLGDRRVILEAREQTA